jgi:hypothetical protein
MESLVHSVLVDFDHIAAAVNHRTGRNLLSFPAQCPHVGVEPNRLNDLVWLPSLDTFSNSPSRTV